MSPPPIPSRRQSTRARRAAWPPVAALLCGCASDPVAIQNLQRMVPGQADFTALVLDYPGILVQEPRLEAIMRQRPPAADAFVPAQAFCAHLPALEQMHAALIAYTEGLLNAARAATPAGIAVSAAAEGPAERSAQCPPATLPVAEAAAFAGRGDRPAGESAVTLTAGLQAFAKAVPGLGISQAQAAAAGSLAQLLVDAATAVARERAVRTALRTGHDAFLGALDIEAKIMRATAERAGQYAGIADSQLGSLAATEGQAGRGLAQQVALQLLTASYFGRVARPQDALAIRKAAQAYGSALVELRKAYLALYERAVSGRAVLTAGTWDAIEPLVRDVAAASAALSSL